MKKTTFLLLFICVSSLSSARAHDTLPSKVKKNTVAICLHNKPINNVTNGFIIKRKLTVEKIRLLNKKLKNIFWYYIDPNTFECFIFISVSAIQIYIIIKLITTAIHLITD